MPRKAKTSNRLAAVYQAQEIVEERIRVWEAALAADDLNREERNLYSLTQRLATSNGKSNRRKRNEPTIDSTSGESVDSNYLTNQRLEEQEQNHV